ncbi:MAG: tetratricopeptide repeat protein [Phycisphaerales bacterium JB039]
MTALKEQPAQQQALKGHRVAFTGRLDSISRREAQNLVRAAGAEPLDDVTRRCTMLVIGMRGWPLAEDGRLSAKLRRAEKLRAAGGRIQIISEQRFRELAGLAEARRETKSFSIDRVAESSGVSAETIHRWERFGLVHADPDGRYDFRDIVSARTLAELAARGVRPGVIRDSLAALARTLPGTDRPLSQLKLIASEDGELLAAFEGALLDPTGQHIIDFERAPSASSGAHASGAAEIDPRPLPRPTTAHVIVQAESPDEAFDRACWLEAEERFEEAADAYRSVAARQPQRADAWYNLGNVLRAQGRREAAEEIYQIATSVDPRHALAWYNLADVLEEQGALHSATEALAKALTADPQFADAHFNRASCLMRLGRSADARAHWQAYLKLDSSSEWARQAREALEAS